MNPLVSVIIPVYNVEAYLPECLESVLMSETDRVCYEIILVDDGSADSSGDLCDAYAARYPELVRTIHQSNGGLSSARNTGIRAALGDYIVLLDSDDKLAPGALNHLAACICTDFPDVIVVHVDQFSDGSDSYTLFNGDYPDEGRILNCREAYRVLLKNKKFVTSAWSFVVKRELLKDENITFFEGIYHEDELWTHEVCLAAETLKYSNTPFYLYRVNRSGSIMSSSDIMHLSDKIFILQRILAEAEGLDGSAKMLTEAKAAELYWAIVCGAKDFLNSEHNGKLFEFLEENKRLLLKCKFIAARGVFISFYLFGIKNTEKLITGLKG